MSIVKANGVDLAFESFGDEARPAILLISGLGVQMLRWTDPFCEALAARGYRVIRYDNRDAGLSTHFRDRPPPDIGVLTAALRAGQPPEVPYTLYDMARDAVGLMDALDIRRAHLAGRSMGGMIAQVVASEHAGRVLSLVSIMSSTGNPALPRAAPDLMELMMRPAPDPVSDEAGYMAHRLAFARRIAGSGHPFNEALMSRLICDELKRAHDPERRGRQFAAIAVAGDRRSQLGTIRARTLVIHGSDDPLTLPACGEDTAVSIPGAEYLLIDGMGHDVPPEFYAAIVEGIDRTARGA